MSDTPVNDDRTDDLKHALQSLRPRITVDARQLLSSLQSESSESVSSIAEPTAAPSSRRAPARSTSWWPALTAASWLVTACVWWSSVNSQQPESSEAVNSIAAASHSSGIGSPIDQLGANLAGVEAETDSLSESPALLTSQTSHDTPPFWLSLLGIDFTRQSDAAQERWERMLEQAEAPRVVIATQHAPGDYQSATYASLRDEFDAPIRTNWFEH